MGAMSETSLPGVGVRYDMTTSGRRGVGVVVHQSGRRDLVVYEEHDPDSAAESVELTEDEAHTLGEVLGATPILERIEDALHRVDDLVIAWVHITGRSPVAGLTIAEARVRATTGAGIVALTGEAESIPVPGGAARLDAGLTAIVIGTPSAVRAATSLLSPDG